MLMPYINGTVRKFFATNAVGIYEITTVADPLVSPSVAVVQTNNDHSFVQFATTGGVFLCVVNGTDARQVYDGTSWATTPAITGVASTALSHVWQFKNRLFFVEKNTLNAWYLPTDAIGGAANRIPLGGIFTRGGSLLFGATWSYESTGGGLAEACVFVSTEGEAAVYEGTDPSSASTWQLRNVYRIGRPLGKNASFKAGGDLLIATDVGIVPLSTAIAKDYAALGGSAVSYPIEEEWKAEVAQRTGQFGWQVVMWPTQQMAVVAMPTYGSLAPMCFVINLRTGAWGRYTGWNTACLGLYQDRLFFGTADGKIVECEVGGTDQSIPFTAVYVGLFDDLKTGEAFKSANLARATFRASVPVEEQLSVQTNYEVNLQAAPNASPPSGSSNVWGSATWGVSLWQAIAEKRSDAVWRGVSGSGFALAPTVQITSGNATALDAELVTYTLVYEAGNVVI
jgi:hypothetical protein